MYDTSKFTSRVKQIKNLQELCRTTLAKAASSLSWTGVHTPYSLVPLYTVLTIMMGSSIRVTAAVASPVVLDDGSALIFPHLDISAS
jgi:hypothetical protein